MMTTARAQQRYDHRLRELVRRTEDVSTATDLGVPRSTARGWLYAAPTVVVGLGGSGPQLTEPGLYPLDGDQLRLTEAPDDVHAYARRGGPRACGR